MASLRDKALEYAGAYGWPVFPLVPGGKTPLTSHGFKDATTNSATIEEWWRLTPDANIGIATGEPSGLVVVDIDPRNGGDESVLALLRERELNLPPTSEVRTGGGGTHFYYSLLCVDCGDEQEQHPSKGLVRFEWAATARPEGWWYYRPEKTLVGPSLLMRDHPFKRPHFPKVLAKGIDLKADGGYVVAPPSILDGGGKYVWVVGPSRISPTPDFVQERGTQMPQQPPTRVAGPPDPDDDRPGSEFNRLHTFEEILEPYGWRKVGTDGETTFWCRPGKDAGTSASTNYGGSDLLWVWSTSTDFDPEVSYTKFGAYALLEFGGDFSAAAQSLVEEPSAPLVATIPPEVIRTVASAPVSEYNAGFGPMHFITRYGEYAGKLTDASPEYHEAAALTLLAMMTPYAKAKLAPYPGGLKLNLYLMLVGSSTRSRKSTSQRIALDVLDVLLPNSVLPAKMTTEVFIETMGGRPDRATLWAPDELGVMLGQIYSVGFLGGIEDVLLQLYGGEDYSYVTLNRNSYIRRPHLSILGAATPESIAFAGPQAMLGGLLPRFGVVFPGKIPPAKPAGAAPGVSEEREVLVASLKSILNWQAQGVEMTFTPSALNLLNAGESMLVDKGTHSARLPTMLYKVACLAAAARLSSVVEDVDAAGAVMCVQRWQEGAERLQPYLRRKSGEIEFEAKCRQALDILADLGGLAHRTEVASNLRLSSTTFNAIESTLVSWASIDYDRTAGTWRALR